MPKCAQVPTNKTGDNLYALAYTAYLCYRTLMTTKEETATASVRLYPSTRRRLNVKAAKEGKTLAQVIDELSKK